MHTQMDKLSSYHFYMISKVHFDHLWSIANNFWKKLCKRETTEVNVARDCADTLGLC